MGNLDIVIVNHLLKTNVNKPSHLLTVYLLHINVSNIKQHCVRVCHLGGKHLKINNVSLITRQ